MLPYCHMINPSLYFQLTLYNPRHLKNIFLYACLITSNGIIYGIFVKHGCGIVEYLVTLTPNVLNIIPVTACLNSIFDCI